MNGRLVVVMDDVTIVNLRFFLARNFQANQFASYSIFWKFRASAHRSAQKRQKVVHLSKSSKQQRRYVRQVTIC